MDIAIRADEGIHNRRWKRYITILVLAVIVAMLSSQVTMALVGQGGLWSEKMIGAGGADSNLVLSRDGAGPVVLGMGAICTTQSATNIAMGATTSAQLNGILTDLKGFPNADVWFEWGYTPTTVSIQTPVQPAVGLGTYNDTIAGFDPVETVYFQMVTKTDAIYEGNIVSFQPSEAGGAAGYRIVWWGVLLAIIAGLVIGIIARVDSWEEMLAFVMLCVVAYLIAQAILLNLW